MATIGRTFFGTLVALSTLPAHAPAQPSSPDALTDFGERLVGTWEADDSRHIYEWGVGDRVLTSRSYFLATEGWALVSQGLWYWDPSAETVRGVVVAVDMPVELFEYASRLEGDEIVHDVVSHGEMGGRYVERWRFEGNLYHWSLEQDGREILSGGPYRRER